MTADTIDKAQDKLFEYAFYQDFKDQSDSEDFPSQYSSNPVYSEEVGHIETESEIALDKYKDASICYAHYSG